MWRACDADMVTISRAVMSVPPFLLAPGRTMHDKIWTVDFRPQTKLLEPPPSRAIRLRLSLSPIQSRSVHHGNCYQPRCCLLGVGQHVSEMHNRRRHSVLEEKTEVRWRGQSNDVRKTCVASNSRYDSGAECASVPSRPRAEILYNFLGFVNR